MRPALFAPATALFSLFLFYCSALLSGHLGFWLKLPFRRHSSCITLSLLRLPLDRRAPRRGTYARLDSSTLTAAPRAIIPRMTTSSGYTRQGAIHSLTSSSVATLRFRMAVHIWACDVVRARALALSLAFSLSFSIFLVTSAHSR